MTTVTSNPPPLSFSLLEPGRAVFEFATLPLAYALLPFVPKGDGHPVIALPGFYATDGSMYPLRKYLERHGYDTRPWELGRNTGPGNLGENLERLHDRVMEVHKETGRKVSLIGASLGGIMAREAAKQFPEDVRQVITLGSAFAGPPEASAAHTLIKAVFSEDTFSRLSEEFEDLLTSMSEPPKGVPTTSIFTKTDGVVNWRGCVEQPSPLTDNIEVYSSHVGLPTNAPVMYLLADRLSQPEDDWRPFDRNHHPLSQLIYPSSGHDYFM